MSKTPLGVVNLQVGVFFGCAELELGVWFLAVMRVEGSGATAGSDGLVGVGADEGDGGCGGEVCGEWEKGVGVLEEHDAVGGGAAEEGAVFGAVDGDFRRFDPVRGFVFARLVNLDSVSLMEASSSSLR